MHAGCYHHAAMRSQHRTWPPPPPPPHCSHCELFILLHCSIVAQSQGKMKAGSGCTTLLDLPPAVLHHIVSGFDGPTKHAFWRTCKQAQQVVIQTVHRVSISIRPLHGAASASVLAASLLQNAHFELDLRGDSGSICDFLSACSIAPGHLGAIQRLTIQVQ